MKLSKTLIAVIAVVIVVILAGGLILGLGIVTKGGVVITTTDYSTQTVLQTETQTQPVTETVLSTTSLVQPVSIVTTTETGVSLSQTTLSIPVTLNVTRIESTTVTQTSLSTATTSASGYANLISGANIEFVAGQKFAAMPDLSAPGFNGYYQINYQTNVSTPVQWVVVGNLINETSFAAPSGGVDFPVQAYGHYSIFVINVDCNIACNYAFNVTASIVYEW